MSSFQMAQSFADRRRADGAALLCIHGLENNLPVPELLKLYADANLLHTLPLVVDSHPLPDLERMVLSMGIGAAKQIEHSLTSNTHQKDSTTALADDKGFQRYMALRLQLVEGQQLAQELHEADLVLRKCFMNYISSSIQLHRLMNETDDTATAIIHTLGRIEFGTQAIIASRMKDASRIALVKASQELEEIARTVSGYSGMDIVLGCIPTSALLKDEFLDDDEEDHVALVTGMDGKTIVSTAPLPPPPCLTTATFHVSHSSDSRSARIVVATVRKIASGAIKRVEECNDINQTFMNGVDTLSEGKLIRAPTVTSATVGSKKGTSNGSPSSTTVSASKKPSSSATTTNAAASKSHTKKFIPYDRAEMLEKETGILISPAAKLHFSHIERDHTDVDVLDVKRKELTAYLQKRKQQRELVSSLGHDNFQYNSSSNPDDENGESTGKDGTSVPGNESTTNVSNDVTSSTLSSIMNVVQQMSTALASGGPIDTSSTQSNTNQQLSSLAGSLSTLSSSIVAQVGNVSTKNVMKALASASSLPLDLSSPPPKFNSGRRLPSSATTTNTTTTNNNKPNTPTRKPAIPPQVPSSNRGRSSLSQKATNTMKSLLTNIVPNTTTTVATAASSRSKSQIANENQQILTKSGSLVPAKDESYLRKFGSLMGSLHPHPHVGGLPIDPSSTAAVPSNGTTVNNPDVHGSYGQRILDEAVALATSGVPISRSPSPNSRNKLLLQRQPSQSEMYARETKLVQRADMNFVETAGYVMNIHDLAMKAGKVIYVPPNERPPTSSQFGKGEEIWRNVWADGVALTDPSLVQRNQDFNNTSTLSSNDNSVIPSPSLQPSQPTSTLVNDENILNTNQVSNGTTSVTGSTTKRRASLLRSASSSSANSHLSVAEKARLSVASVSDKHSQRIDRREDRIAAVAAAMEEKMQKRRASVERSHVRAHSPAVRGADLMKTALEQSSLGNSSSNGSLAHTSLSVHQPSETDTGDSLVVGLLQYSRSDSPLRTIPSVTNSTNPTPSPPSSIPRSSPGKNNTNTSLPYPINTMLLSPRTTSTSKKNSTASKSNTTGSKILGSPRMSVSMEVQGIYGTRFGPSAALVKHQAGLKPKHAHHYVAPHVQQETASDQHQYSSPSLLPSSIGGESSLRGTGSEYRSSSSPVHDANFTSSSSSPPSSLPTGSNIGVTYVAVPVMEVNLGKEMFKVLKAEEKVEKIAAAARRLEHSLLMQQQQANDNNNTDQSSTLNDEALQLNELGGEEETTTVEPELPKEDPIVDGVRQSTIGFHVGMVSPRKLILNKMLQRKQVQLPPKLVTIETTDVTSSLVPATSMNHHHHHPTDPNTTITTTTTTVIPFNRTSTSPNHLKHTTTDTVSASMAVQKLLSPAPRPELQGGMYNLSFTEESTVIPDNSSTHGTKFSTTPKNGTGSIINNKNTTTTSTSSTPKNKTNTATTLSSATKGNKSITMLKKGGGRLSVGGQVSSDTAVEIITPSSTVRGGGGGGSNTNRSSSNGNHHHQHHGMNLMMTMDVSEHLRQLAETPLDNE